MIALEVKDLKKYYGKTKAVNGISFSVAENEIFGILGPNGAGKTTTLEMIEGLRKPDAGDIKVCSIPVWPNPTRTKQMIGVQLQSTALFDYLTVKETIRLFAALYNISFSRQEVTKILEEVGLSEKISARVNELSGGQQQRLSIALALVNNPKIIFLDEPTTGLDPQARRRLWQIIQKIKSEGKTVVLTTHYMEEAQVLCDRVAIMDHGKIISLDTPDGLIRSLGADSKISFLCQQKLPAEKITNLPAVSEYNWQDSEHTLFTKEPQLTIRTLFELAEKEGVKIEDIRVSGANLEDVFLHLTGRGLRD